MPDFNQRQVGKRSDAWIPAKTTMDFAANLMKSDHLQKESTKLCPFIRKPYEDGEPRVKRFRTLEEMNTDQEKAKAEFMTWLYLRRCFDGT